MERDWTHLGFALIGLLIIVIGGLLVGAIQLNSQQGMGMFLITAGSLSLVVAFMAS